VNLTREFLVGELPVPFDPGQTVLEVLETIEVDDEVEAGVRRLAAAGYRIAIDDFVWGTPAERLLPLADYVKLDLLDTDAATLAATVRQVREVPGNRLIAERVESAPNVRYSRGAAVTRISTELVVRAST
jgi:EAL and modified HD-GYP domain-containing signal transduction protein